MKISGLSKQETLNFEKWIKEKYNKTIDEIWDEAYEKEYSAADADELLNDLYESYLNEKNRD